MNIVNTPCIALDYLMAGDDSNISPEVKKIADDWSKDWEIVSIEDYIENENLSEKITNSILRDIDTVS